MCNVFFFLFFLSTLWRQSLQAQLHHSSGDAESSGFSTAGTRSTEERMWQRWSYTSKGKKCEESSIFVEVETKVWSDRDGRMNVISSSQLDLSHPACLQDSRVFSSQHGSWYPSQPDKRFRGQRGATFIRGRDHSKFVESQCILQTLNDWFHTSLTRHGLNLLIPKSTSCSDDRWMDCCLHYCGLRRLHAGYGTWRTLGGWKMLANAKKSWIWPQVLNMFGRSNHQWMNLTQTWSLGLHVWSNEVVDCKIVP